MSAHVSRVATQRLIDAAATLDAPDRALLNIWVNRGLDGAAVARMTGVSEKAIADRRIRIVEHLSSVLDLPEDHVRNALIEITPSSDARPDRVSPQLGPGAQPEPAGATHGGATHAGAAGAAVRKLDAGAASQRRRRLWGLAAVVMIVVGVVLVLSLASSVHGRHSTPTHARAPASRGSSSRTPATAPTQAAPAGQLTALPGGPGSATGSVRVTGQGRTLRLNLSVSGLPPISRGRYVAWLYTSLVNSERLGQLPGAAGQQSLRVPPNAKRYYWIDISYQPPGAVFHSGDSLLRGANPLHAR